MPVGTPKVRVPYDSEGNIPIRVKKKDANKQRFHEEDFNEFFLEGIDEEFAKGSGSGSGSDSDSGYDSAEDLEDFLNGINEESEFERHSQKEEEVRFDEDDEDDSPYEAAKKRKKKKEEEKAKVKWYDLLDVVHREGLIFLGQEMTMKVGSSVVSLMIYLEQENKPNRIPTMLINSPGGFVFAGLAIYDTMSLIRDGNKVQTLVIGIAASMASVVLIGGGLRVASPHARVMIHQPRMKPFEDESTEIALESRVLLDLRINITEIYVQKTGHSHSKISEDMEHDTFMTAEQASSYRIVDGVVQKKPLDIYDLICRLNKPLL